MQFYRVVNHVAVIGAGDVAHLTDLQFAARAHNVELVRRDSKGVTVRAKVPLEFKVGEVIGLPDAPKVLASCLEVIAESKPAKSVAA